MTSNETIAQLITLFKIETATTITTINVALPFLDLREPYVSETILPPQIVLNRTFGERSHDTWISSISGDLSIRNLHRNDSAVYKCGYRGIFSEPTELRIGKIPVLHE